MKLLLFFLFFFIPTTSNGEEPWGIDSELAQNFCASCELETCSTPVLGWLGETMILFHQKVISPADGPRSHFKPSSSQYALESMRKYGFLTGLALGCDRLMRENDDPWIYRKLIDTDGTLIKYDPIP